MNTISGVLSAQKTSFGIVVSRFNSIVTEKLLTGAIDCLVRHGGDEKNITVVWCPGSFEITSVAKKMVEAGNLDAVICLGCIIRGETPHFDYVASAASRGIAELSANGNVPVSFGVLTTETMEQALDRAGGKSGNKGWDSAMSAMEMVDLFKKISKTS